MVQKPTTHRVEKGGTCREVWGNNAFIKWETKQIKQKSNTSSQSRVEFPYSAQRLQRALAKEGVPARVKDIEELLTSKEASRQVQQPPPRNIASTRLDDRWVADMMSFVANPAKDGETTWKYVLLVQDIFSHK